MEYQEVDERTHSWLPVANELAEVPIRRAGREVGKAEFIL